MVWSARYSAYGKLSQLSHGGGEQLEQPLRFQGQYFDAESGLHYNRHRYYQPDSGRYLTPDPVKLAGGLNAYRYVPNPTGWVDPLGLSGNCPGANKPGCSAPDGVVETTVDGGEVTLPSTGKESEYLYRGDTRPPSEIFNTGFMSLGKSTDLKLHVLDNRNPPSNFVSTSTDPEIGIDFGTKFRTNKGFLYTLNKIYGHDINKELHQNDIPYSYEDEIAIPDRIKSENILGATPLKKDGSYVGHSIPNPKGNDNAN
nr:MULTISPECIES: RHS repeat-associated core domain-containing protein [unclassified Pseudomonas]